MAAKLTLSIDENTIKRAKLVSRKKGKSISKLVEEYLNTLSEKEEQKESVMDKIHKILDGKITNPKIDWKDAKYQHLKKKYGL